MLQYLFLMSWKRKKKVKYTLDDLPRPKGGIIGRLNALFEGRRIIRLEPQKRLDLLNYCVETGMKDILSKKPKTENDQVAYNIIQGYPISTHNESRYYSQLGGWEGKVKKWKNQSSCKPKVKLPWVHKIKLTRGIKKVCVWYGGDNEPNVRAILENYGYKVLKTVDNDHIAYSTGLAWINNQKNKGKKMALIVHERKKGRYKRFELYTAKSDWQYIYYKKK